MRHHHNTSRRNPTPEETSPQQALQDLKEAVKNQDIIQWEDPAGNTTFVNISQAEYWTIRHGGIDQIPETLA